MATQAESPVNTGEIILPPEIVTLGQDIVTGTIQMANLFLAFGQAKDVQNLNRDILEEIVRRLELRREEEIVAVQLQRVGSDRVKDTRTHQGVVVQVNSPRGAMKYIVEGGMLPQPLTSTFQEVPQRVRYGTTYFAAFQLNHLSLVMGIAAEPKGRNKFSLVKGWLNGQPIWYTREKNPLSFNETQFKHPDLAPIAQNLHQIREDIPYMIPDTSTV